MEVMKVSKKDYNLILSVNEKLIERAKIEDRMVFVEYFVTPNKRSNSSIGKLNIGNFEKFNPSIDDLESNDYYYRFTREPKLQIRHVKHTCLSLKELDYYNRRGDIEFYKKIEAY